MREEKKKKEKKRYSIHLLNSCCVKEKLLDERQVGRLVRQAYAVISKDRHSGALHTSPSPSNYIKPNAIYLFIYFMHLTQ